VKAPLSSAKLVDREIELPRCIVPPLGFPCVVVIQPDEPFRPNFLVIENPDNWVIQEVRVGVVPQLKAATPAHVFNNAWTFGLAWRCDLVHRGMYFEVRVASLDEEREQTFEAKVIGKVLVADKPTPVEGDAS
jgi:hypothetical protein